LEMKDEKCPCCGRGPSSQVRWQRKMLAEGRCVKCGNKAVKGNRMCLFHAVNQRENQRIRKGSKARYAGALTYRLEAQKKKCV